MVWYLVLFPIVVFLGLRVENRLFCFLTETRLGAEGSQAGAWTMVRGTDSMSCLVGVATWWRLRLLFIRDSFWWWVC